jgi:hypothetical protein
MKRILFGVIAAAFLISRLFLLGYCYLSQYGPFGFVISDVSKRLEAPDHSKTALLFDHKNQF